MDDLDLKKGTVISNTYRLDLLLARGGMGAVYKGKHLRLGKEIAVKLMLPQLVKSEEQTKRFLNEAVGIANIQHRNIVQMIDIGMTEDSIPFFVMEYLRGETLRERLKRRSRLQVKEAARIMIQTLSGLSVLHSKKIVHRDMKPSNIFIAKEADGADIVKILDFGVSKFHMLEGDELHELTTTGTILGTPSYMSPEQAGGKRTEIGSFSDLYSCGVILYRAVAGINPFRGENYNETIANILNAPVPQPSFFVPNLSRELDNLILRAIDRDKHKRFRSCQAFIDALKDFVDADDLIKIDVADLVEEGEIMSDIPGREAERSGRGLTPSLQLGSTPGLSTSMATHSIDAVGAEGAAGRKKSRFWMGVAVVLAVAVVGTVSMLIYNNFIAAASKDEKALSSQEAKTETDADKIEECTLTIAGIPDSAILYVDGAVYLERPVVLEKKYEPRTIKVEAQGYKVWEKTVVIRSDTTLPIKLVPIAPPEKEITASKEEKSGKPKDKKKPKTEGKKKEKPDVTEKQKRKILTIYPDE